MTMYIFTLTSVLMEIFERFLILFLCAAAMLWIYSVIRCYYSKKGKTPLKIIVSRAFIEGAIVCIIALAIYFAFFIKTTGWQRFVWDEWYWSFSRNTYLMLLPEILIFIILSVFFLVKTNQLSKLFNRKS